jgi:hypothetical protein
MTARALARSRKAIAAGVSLAALIAVLPAIAQSPTAGKTRGMVVTYFWHATYQGDDDCPAGPAEGMRRLAAPFLERLAPDERAKLLKPGNEQNLAGTLSAFALGGNAYGGQVDKTKEMWGPKLAPQPANVSKEKPRGVRTLVADQCLYPAEFEDPPIRQAQGRVSYGLDLDNNRGSGPAAPNTCGHRNFEGPNGEAGIDNQMYRLIGCIDGYRRKASQSSPTSVSAGTMEDWYHGNRKDGSETALIEISGIDDHRNDPDVTVAIYGSKQATPFDSQGKKGIPSFSLTAAPISPDRANVFHAKIVDGELITDRADLAFPYIPPTASMKPLPYLFKSGQMRLKLTADGGAEGLVGGYLDLDDVYYIEFTSFPGTTNKVTVFDGSCPAFHAGLRTLADGYPDPATGKCTAISAAFKVEAVKAYVIHAPQTQTAQAAQLE